MARRKINLNNIKEQVIEEEIIENSEESLIEPMGPAGGELSATKPKRKGLLFLSLLLIFIVLLSVTLRIILPQGEPIPTIDIKFDCITDIKMDIGTSGQFTDRDKLLPGDTLDASVEFWLEPTENTDYSLKNQVFVKTRIYGKLDDEYLPNLFGYELDGNWMKSINGYYYYNKIISLGENGEIVPEKFETKIKIEKTVGNKFQGKNVQLIIEFSILQAEYDAITDVWKDAPYSWRQDMYNRYFAEQ